MKEKSKNSKVRGKPFPKGVVQNPLGAPEKMHWWSQLYKDELELESLKLAGVKKKVAVVRATVEKAENGDIAAIKEIGDRVQGKSPQSVGYIDDDGKFKPQDHVVIWE